MPQSTTEKRERFSRIFPARVDKLIDTIRLIGNCTSKSNYSWNEDVVKRVWIEIAKHLKTAAKDYDLELTVMVNGDEVQYVDTSQPLESTSTLF